MSNAPWSIAEAAISLHELYLSLINAGFSEDQAFALVIETMRGGLHQ